MKHPVNPDELKSWIVSHANYYRKMASSTKSEGAKEHFQGHVKAMRALWDAMKVFHGINFVGLFKEMDRV